MQWNRILSQPVQLQPSHQSRVPCGKPLSCSGLSRRYNNWIVPPSSSYQLHAYFSYLVCTEGMLEFVNHTIRFDNDLESFSAVVQVCINGQYGYICADNWDNREADVVCRSYSSFYQHPYYGIIIVTFT